MKKESEEKYFYSHGYSLENIGSMAACTFGSAVLFHEYLENSQLWVLVLAILCSGLALFTIDLVVTKVSIYADNIYLYIKPIQPITFKKRYRFRRSDIKRSRVDTSKENTRYGPVVTYTVVLLTKDGKRHNVLIPRNKKEAIRIKKELSRWRHA
ncbi:hypothetical protein [Teredinibacter sp. KSP-S5-2]|uniref:hypothetical protein n=1 Tax=Teredinibacter sp. KSP-S5-2 TaxID=3034506 RepID=UPI0029344DD3|nr:hypothetical protein [Teredinibacter sp. KSP-S5-2]WNO11273.1 hypothetical protein P5V12_08825 [Teredinibacter sp. KSP-S5-2]